MMTRRHFLAVCMKTMTALVLSEVFHDLPAGMGSAHLSVPVLLYHRVGYTSGPLTVTPERFASDLAYLRDHGYQGISLEDFHRSMIAKTAALPEKPILITFDDGYLDNYDQAYPLLDRFTTPATFFIITSLLGAGSRLADKHIQRLARAGMSFGSHTVSHRRLDELPDEQVRHELSDSKTCLEGVLGKPVVSLAYPQGGYNNKIIELACNAGYVSAFTTTSGVCSRSTAALELKRIPVFSYDADVIAVMAQKAQVQFSR